MPWQVTHATPAALYAKTADRKWECDSNMPDETPEQVEIRRKLLLLFWLQAWDIARQLVETERGSRMEVVLGGGLKAFLPPNQTIPQVSPYRPSGWEKGCRNGRKDGRDLVGEWEGGHPQGQAVHTREELLQVNFNSTEQLLGLFSHSVMPFDDEREAEGVTPRCSASPILTW